MADGKQKMYKGGYQTLERAAAAYDKAAIQIKGINVRSLMQGDY